MSLDEHLQNALGKAQNIESQAASAQMDMENSEAPDPGVIAKFDQIETLAAEAAEVIVTLGSTSIMIPEEWAGGAQDVGDLIHYFLLAHPEIDVFHFKDGALYWCENTIAPSIPEAERTMRLEGHGATLFTRTDGAAIVTRPGQSRHLWPRTRKHIQAKGVGKIEIVDLLIQGSHPFARDADTHNYVEYAEGQHAFDFDGLSKVLLERCSVRDVYGDMVYLSGGVSNVLVQLNDFDGCGRQGWAIVGAQNVRYTQNKLNHVGRSMFDIEPNGSRAVVRHILLDHNEIGINRLTGFAHGGAAVQIEDVEISDNTYASPMNMIIRAGSRPGIKNPDGTYQLDELGRRVPAPDLAEKRRANYRILRNVGTAGFGSPQAMIRFDRVDGIEVVGNKHRIACGAARGSTGVQTINCTGVDVHDNLFEGTWAKPAEKELYPLKELDEIQTVEPGSYDWFAPVR